MNSIKKIFENCRSARVVSLAILLFVTGCSAQKAYEGSFDQSQTSRIVGQGVKFVEVNGHSIGMNAPEVEVLAGPVNVKLKVDRSNYNAPDAGMLYRLNFNAVGGQDYVVNGHLKICLFPRNQGSSSPSSNTPVACVTKE